jgi:hypothetical protein
MFIGASVFDIDVSGLFLGVGVTASGLFAMMNGTKDLNRAWKVSATDLVSISEAVATDELVQITGSVQPSRSSSVIVSPVRNEECVAYEYQIRSQLSDNSTNIDSGIKYHPFNISGGTAEIVVDPTQKKTVTGAHRVSKKLMLREVTWIHRLM